MTTSMIIAAVLICLGMLFMLASLIGIVRLPDFFTRLHAQGVGDTLGAFLILAGMVAAVGANLLSFKILLIFIIIVLTNPIGTNLMMIAAINKEDYQGYSTLMSGGESKDQIAEKKADQSEVKEPVMVPKTEPKIEQKVEIREQKTGETGKTAEVREQKAAEKEEERKEKRPRNKKKKPKGEQNPRGEKREPKGEKKIKDEKKPKGEKKDLKGAEKEPEGEQRKQKKGNRRKSNKPSMKMNKTELLAAAAKRGIDVPEGATKREILDLIYSDKDKKRT